MVTFQSNILMELSNTILKCPLELDENILAQQKYPWLSVTMKNY